MVQTLLGIIIAGLLAVLACNLFLYINSGFDDDPLTPNTILGTHVIINCILVALLICAVVAVNVPT